jgi:pyrimidine-specific ribonucleoside hydrolase
VPAGAGSFLPLRSPDDPAPDAPTFLQQGVELILRTLRESDQPLDIAIFCSSRAVTAAFNRDPELLRQKVRRIHLSAGGHPRGYLEWNVRLDPHAFVGLLHSGLPIDIYPCAAHQGPFDLGANNSF